MDLYEQNILDHYRRPRNKGKIKDADAHYHEVNDTCGDEISVDLKMDKNRIKQIKFDGHGCTISQAAISILSETLVGKTKKEVMTYEFKNLEDQFGIKVSESRYKCALLGLWAIQHALEKY